MALVGGEVGAPRVGQRTKGNGRASVGNEGAGGLVGDRKVLVTWCR